MSTTPAPDLMANLAESLKQTIAAQKGQDEGTVVVFVRREDAGEATLADREPRLLTYAALFAGGKWWLTGSRSRPPMTHRAFTDLLATDRVVGAELVTATEVVK